MSRTKPPHHITLTPAYLVMYPEIANAAMAIVPIVQDLRSTSVHGGVELEARFGRIISVPGREPGRLDSNRKFRFEPGVSEPFITHIITLLDSYTEWESVIDWSPEQDFFYNDINGDPVRTRVSYDAEFATRTEHVRKRKRQMQDLKNSTPTGLSADTGTPPWTPPPVKSSRSTDPTQRRDSTNPADDSGLRNPFPEAVMSSWDVRISLNTEEPVDESLLPATIVPTFVRLKNRKSYLYRPKEYENAIWRYDISVCWEGLSQSEVEKKQKMDPGRIEIECEIINPTEYMNTAGHDDLYVSTSLLLKIRDLLGRHGRYVLEPFQTRRINTPKLK